MKLFHQALQIAVYGNLVISAGCVALMLETMVYAGLGVQCKPYLLTGFSFTLFIYTLHRLSGIQFDPGNSTARHTWAVENVTLLRVLLVISVAAGVLSLFWLPIKVFIALCLFGFLAIGYTLPLLPGKKRLRDIPVLKTFLVSFVWTVITVMIPMLAEEINLLKHQHLFLERFCFIMAITIPFDIRDLSNDRSKNVKTMVHYTGPVVAGLIAFGFCMIALMYSGGIFLNALIFYSLIAALALLSIKARHEYFYLFVLDGTMLLKAGLLIVPSIF